MNKWVLTVDKFLNESEIKVLRRFCEERAEFDEIRGRKQAIRQWMAIDLALSSGVRVSEVANLQVKDIFVGYGQSIIVIRNSKNGKTRNVIISDRLKNHLKKYLEWKKEIGEGETEYLLISERKQKYTISGLQKLAKQVMKLAGLPSRYSFHSLRHSFCSSLYRVTKDLRLCQLQAGHSSPAVTTIYANLCSDEIKQGMDKLYEG